METKEMLAEIREATEKVRRFGKKRAERRLLLEALASVELVLSALVGEKPSVTAGLAGAIGAAPQRR